MSIGAATPFSIMTHGDYATGVRVLLRGELDLFAVGRFSDVIAQHRRHGRNVLLDLSELEFIDSSGIRAVIDATAEAQVNGWAFGVGANMRPQVLRAFELTGLLARLPIADAA